MGQSINVAASQTASSQPTSDSAPQPTDRWLSFAFSGTVAGVLWVSAAVYGISAVMFVSVWMNWSAYMSGDGRFAALQASDTDALNFLGSIIYFATWSSGILFVIWLYQAYRSAESRGATGRRWGPGWAIGGWFIPLANAVIPKLVMNEIDRMSNPDAGKPPINERWKRLPRMRSSDLWWFLLLGGTALFWIGSEVYYSTPAFDTSATGTGYLLIAISQGVLALAAALTGVLSIAVGRRIRRP